ncbi:N-terminal EF-hand calcium-binding protein 1-like [Dendronephthya gigantea]|uniref:N-terminal EF-hand calcium-binding protein 1-like n=1 Tax=Dendronephthya gigantea TaxID=151771 RepID=UPI00106DC77B|nr:N-terminal EF-hand calcium-binding protein 1-like [Dendronephthya gigantea]
MAETGTANEQVKNREGLTIFQDVFRRADKNDDGALSMAEFKTFFNDGILSEKDLEKLFNDIDTHNTANIDTQELCDYFQEHLGPFSSIFSGLENMNTAVNSALLETSKSYPDASFFAKFTRRFLMQEVVNQLGSVQYHVDTALDKIEEGEQSTRTDSPYVEQRKSGMKSKIKKKMENYQQQMSNEGNSVSRLSSQVDRLADLVNKLESKVKFRVVEEEINPKNDKMVIIVRRKFVVNTEGEDEFKASLRTYINATGLAQGCIELSIRAFTGSDVYVLYEIWSSKDNLNRYYTSTESRTFLRSNVDHLQQPEEYSQMPIPAVWLGEADSSEELL